MSTCSSTLCASNFFARSSTNEVLPTPIGPSTAIDRNFMAAPRAGGIIRARVSQGKRSELPRDRARPRAPPAPRRRSGRSRGSRSVGRDLGERREHEAPLPHARMRQRRAAACRSVRSSEQQEIEVERARRVRGRRGPGRAPPRRRAGRVEHVLGGRSVSTAATMLRNQAAPARLDRLGLPDRGQPRERRRRARASPARPRAGAPRDRRGCCPGRCTPITRGILATPAG